MKFKIQKEVLLPALQMVSGVVEKRSTLPIISNVLVRLHDQRLTLTGTDCEIELTAQLDLPEKVEDFAITLPGRKWLDICRSLPDEAIIEISFEQSARCIVRSGKSRFTLSTLPASDFPNVEIGPGVLEFSLHQAELRTLIEQTYFAMGQADVRHYLNGMSFEVGKNTLRTIAADGHRLATTSLPIEANNLKSHQVIIPRKAVIELLRLLHHTDEEVSVVLCNNHIRVIAQKYTFISKLIDGRYPDFQKVVPLNADKTVTADKELFQQALQRAAILSNEKARGIRLQLTNGLIRISANNPEQDEAEDEFPVEYNGKNLDIALNVVYLLDVLQVLESSKLQMRFGDADTSVLLEEIPAVSAENEPSALGDANNVADTGKQKSLYVVMPMRI